MAATTAAALITELRTDRSIDVGSPDPISITQEVHDSATYSRYYCIGNVEPYIGKAMWVKTTVAGTAGAQADEIRAALTSAGSVDPDAQV